MVSETPDMMDLASSSVLSRLTGLDLVLVCWWAGEGGAAWEPRLDTAVTEAESPGGEVGCKFSLEAYRENLVPTEGGGGGREALERFRGGGAGAGSAESALLRGGSWGGRPETGYIESDRGGATGGKGGKAELETKDKPITIGQINVTASITPSSKDVTVMKLRRLPWC